LAAVAEQYNGTLNYNRDGGLTHGDTSRNEINSISSIHFSSGVRRKYSWGGLVQGHMVVICI